MNTMEAIATRRSIRNYSDIEVTAEHIDQLIRAAMMAPSAGNQQPWHFLVVRDREKLAAIPRFHPHAAMLKKAQVAVVICGDPEGKRWPDFWVQDCSAATQNMLLAARDLGLGTVWTGVYPVEERMAGMRTLFEIPSHIIPFAVVPVGWPTSEFSVQDRYAPTLIHHESW